jgi:hypothetical protein
MRIVLGDNAVVTRRFRLTLTAAYWRARILALLDTIVVRSPRIE